MTIDSPIFTLPNGDKFRISFTGQVLIDNISQNDYYIKIFNEEGLIEERISNSFTWVAYPLDYPQNYTVEFWEDGELISTYKNDLTLKTSKMLFNVKFPPSYGKVHDISSLDEAIKTIKKKYPCDVYVYFKGSEKYDLSSKNYYPLRMNDSVYYFNLMMDLYV